MATEEAKKVDVEETMEEKTEKKADKATPRKKATPKKKEEPEESQEEGEEEDDKPKEEAPVSGKRQRKSVEFFKPQEKVKEEFVIKPGKGTALGSIPNFHYRLSKHKGDDDIVKILHGVLFKRPGTANQRKRNICQFSGFVADDDKHMEKVVARLNTLKLNDLHVLMDMVDLPRGSGDEGKKESKVQRLADFLEAPNKLSSKDIAAAEKEKKEKEKAKREKKKTKKTPGSTKKKVGEKRKAEEQSGDESDSESESEQEEEEEEVPKKTPAKTPKKTPAKSPKTATKKDTETKPKKARKTDASDTPSNKKKAETPAKSPASAKAKAKKGGEDQPSDDVLHAAIRDVVASEDPNQFSVKQLMKTLQERFPDANLQDRKKSIKEYAVQCVQPAEAASKEGMAKDTPSKEGDAKDASATEGEAEAGKSSKEEDAKEGGASAKEGEVQEEKGGADEAKEDEATPMQE